MPLQFYAVRGANGPGMASLASASFAGCTLVPPPKRKTDVSTDARAPTRASMLMPMWIRMWVPIAGAGADVGGEFGGWRVARGERRMASGDAGVKAQWRNGAMAQCAMAQWRNGGCRPR